MRILLAPVLVAGLGLLLATGESFADVQPCTGNCVQASVVSPSGTFNNGQTVDIPVTFHQGDADLGSQAAIALTMAIPSLKLANCDNPTPDGITSAIQIPSGVSDQFRVVVENTVCNDSGKPCLCPTATDGSQTRADYINLVIFGPKVLPTPGSGEVTFPLLPNDTLVTFSLTVDNPTTSPLVLHLFAETDNGVPSKPQFGALLSIGNNQAVDQTVNRDSSISNVTTTDGSINVTTVSSCVGDCDNTGHVSLANLRVCVNIFVGTAPLSSCPAMGAADLAHLRQAVNNFVAGMCPAS